MRKRVQRANPGAGSIFWSDSQDRFVAEIALGRDDTGRRVTKRLVGPRGNRSDDARLGLRDRLQQEQRKRPARPRKHQQPFSRITVGQYLEEWLATKTNLSESAKANYAWANDKHITPGLGTVRLYDLDRQRLRQFFGNLPTLGDAGKAKVLVVLRAALQDAVSEFGYITVNPATRLRIEKARQSPPQIETWNPQEAKRFLKTAKGTEHFPLFLLMLTTGIGPAEVFGLKWRDVDLQTGHVAIVRNLTEVGGQLFEKETKTPSRRRNLPLPRIALRALKKRHHAMRPKPNDYVFPAPQGGGWRRTNFRLRVFLPLVKKAKVRPISTYGLRHTAASAMAALGVPMLFVSRTLGHSRISTTADIYSSVFPESQREVAGRFDSFLKDL